MNPFKLPTTRAEWRSDRWGRMRCLAAWDETADVRSFLLAPEDGLRLSYEPGQFLTVRIPVEGEPELLERCYTLSSSAAGERSAVITVKRKAGGRGSGVLHETLRPGTTVEAFGPAGRFGPSGTLAARYLLLSAGSGVTPMLSVVRTAADLGLDLDAVFVHGARTPADVIARDDLVALSRRLPRLRLVPVASRPDAAWAGEHGRLDADKLARLVPDLADRTVLCCGPEPFMAAMREACLAAGVPAERYTEESFDFGAIDVEVPADGPLRRITFAKSGREFDCPANLTILQAAKLAGVPMASSCTRGVCGTCKCLKLSGSVTMSHGGGIRDREVARGFILPCSSRPDTDVTLDR